MTARPRPHGLRENARPEPDEPREPARQALARHGPNLAEAAIRVHAEDVTTRLATQRARWRRGFTRRRVIAGAGAVGVAALGSQLATTRVAYGDPAATRRTLVVVFLRGGMDGLSVVVPGGDPDLYAARPGIAVPAAALLPADNRFGLHPALAPLYPLWKAGTMAAVHAVASPDASRSHFQAQDCLERGAASVSVGSGWLDRVLEALGPGTTFRAVAEGSSLPRSLVGASEKLVLRSIREYRIDGAGGAVRDRTVEALRALYTGIDHPVAAQARNALQSLATARRIAEAGYDPAQPYPGGGFADQLRDVARLVKNQVGLRVAAIDVGGWDMHTGLGTVDGGDMRNQLTSVAESLAAFAADLGPALADVTLVTMSEFGRRVAENGNAGTDHGHGGVMLLLGGGLVGGRVHGRWPGLAEAALDHGDVARANDYRDVLGELLSARLGVTDLPKIFPGHTYHRLGVFR
ncbi:MAG TPA: DUF1501 domain-containing protein [Micromonosporaceae bacterium]|nr:DUF1501 domain-containing protein [Micromonosporaceae bacterium]